jgi:2-iminoacetate synthase
MSSLDIVDERAIGEALDIGETEPARVRDIIAKARELKGLDLPEAAALLTTQDKNLEEEIFEAARDVKLAIYGRRLVLFAPLYIDNHCSNNCLYCAFRRDNSELIRRTLTLDEIAEEVRLLENQGHKRLLMLMGEDSEQCNLDHFISAIETAYATKTDKGEIRRINVEIAPLSVDDFRRLKAARIGTYVVFQETYHRTTYEQVHPSGRKADYEWRVTAMDRAMQAGIDDVGIGVLFGLYDYRFEVLALLTHARYLDSTYGVGPHTISVPRIYPAKGAPLSFAPPHPVSDDQFKRLVAVLRLSVPYTGMILSTRESPKLRHEVFELGISQISAGSRTNPGGYQAGREHSPDDEQFSLGDTRKTDDVIRAVVDQGYIPSFCTACYRLGRTGHDFMDLAKPGMIQHYCLPNAILTFQEYLEDYASNETREVGNRLVESMLADIPTEKRRIAVKDRIERIKAGERDLYF